MDKTWTATDIRLGKLTIRREGTTLCLQRRYVFVDANGDVLRQIAGGNVVEEVELEDVPLSILTALQVINNWTRQKALEKEGMDGDPN